MTERRRVPSKDDIARARRLDAERSRGLETICESVRSRFRDATAFREVFVLPQGDGAYRAYVFYSRESDVGACQTSGASDSIVAFVRARLDRLRGTSPGELDVTFEFDSEENVDANFGGDYFKRLR
jgi:hypothetical protein